MRSYASTTISCAVFLLLLLGGGCVAEPWHRIDQDGDGFRAGEDCDDLEPAANPDSREVCDGIDNDCDGRSDDDDPGVEGQETWNRDADGDGFGDAQDSISACFQPTGYVSDNTDCEDGDASINPTAPDNWYDGVDSNCDGANDFDQDGDGYDSGEYGGDDCNDNSEEVRPGVDEFCNGIDDDCDGLTDEDDAVDALTWFADADQDGYGDAADTAFACELPAGFVANDTDCDDSRALTNPSADETCDGLHDDDCDGVTDEPDAIDSEAWYLDSDGDGYGDATVVDIQCELHQPPGYVRDNTDCDDTDAADYPSAPETVANDDDEDCDGGDICYQDLDGDTQGTSETILSTDTDCADSGESYNDDDCNDTDAGTFLGADEYCDGQDNDCDGFTDEDDAVDVTTWYQDADADTYGNAAVSGDACYQPPNYVLDNTDCDDTESEDHPGAAEIIANNDDEDCDGGDTCYEDLDHDTYGTTNTVDSFDLDCLDAGESEVATDCDDLSATLDPADADGDGFATCDADCDDTDALNYPGAVLDHEGIAMTCIGPGSFTMGSPPGEVGRDTDETEHVVTLTTGFHIGLFEVTQEEFEDFMGYENFRCAGCDHCPAEYLDWNEAAAFANAVSDAAGLPHCYDCTGSGSSVSCVLDASYATPYDCAGYRLPTEAEWERAARAGTESAFNNGGNLYSSDIYSCSETLQLDNGSYLADIAVFCGNYPGENSEVGALDPNAWGLYDVHGNVVEWCHDLWDGSDYAGDVVDPWGDPSGSMRVCRGGTWYNDVLFMRSASRQRFGQIWVDGSQGFRLARSD